MAKGIYIYILVESTFTGLAQMEGPPGPLGQWPLPRTLTNTEAHTTLYQGPTWKLEGKHSAGVSVITKNVGSFNLPSLPYSHSKFLYVLMPLI